MTALPRQRHRRHANPFTIRGPLPVPDWHRVYGRVAPFALDIGCGPGQFTCALAAAHPEWNVLGVEIRQHLVQSTLAAGRAAGLSNVHAVLANANAQLVDLLPPRSVAFVAVNFPDPWYKKRHHKRRVVQRAWLDILCPKLLSGAEFHAMTDYEPVAQEIRDALNNHPNFCPVVTPGGEDSASGFAATSTTGLTSEREIKHLQRGEQIYRMQYVYGLAKVRPDPVKAGDPQWGW